MRNIRDRCLPSVATSPSEIITKTQNTKAQYQGEWNQAMNALNEHHNDVVYLNDGGKKIMNPQK